MGRRCVFIPHIWLPLQDGTRKEAAVGYSLGGAPVEPEARPVSTATAGSTLGFHNTKITTDIPSFLSSCHSRVKRKDYGSFDQNSSLSPSELKETIY